MSQQIRKTELLAPAGSVGTLKAVIAAGADAVYIGGTRFGARAYADNPDEDELLRAIDYAHLRGVKVYLTVNTLLKEQELAAAADFVLPYYRRGVDAVLVQDFGVLRLLRRTFPDLPLHASTQMTVTGPAFAALLKDNGITRVVPARELSLKELKAIRGTGVEVETFVHGALCVCYSGQCLYSSLLGGRSGNRGRCAQPCRLLYLSDRPDFHAEHSILEEKDARHFLSTKDLCAIDLLPELISAGIDSLKIEGRMKKPEYAAGVTSVYRKYLDLAMTDPEHFLVAEEDRAVLMGLYNRSGFTDGYFHRRNGPEMMAPVKHELTRQEAEERHRLYALMKERYIDREKKIPVRIEAGVYAGKALGAAFSACGVRVTVSGEKVEKAKKQPLTKERIRDSLSKTGGSDFVSAEVRIRTDGESFVPVSALNDLRRRGTELLREKILEDFRRTSEEMDAPPNLPLIKTSAASVPELRALVSTGEQLEAVLAVPGVEAVDLEASFLCGKDGPDSFAHAEKSITQILAAGKKCGVATPFIDRGGKMEASLRGAIPRFLEMGASVILVRSAETASALLASGFGKYLAADAGLYTYNREAEAFLMEQGISSYTAPFELNRRELFSRADVSSGIYIYGRLPLMVSAQCLAGREGSACCAKSRPARTLTDRMGASFTVSADCSFCYTVIRNSVCLNLIPELPSLMKMGFSSVRLMFTGEDGEETDRIARLAQEALAGRPVEFHGNYTKGHFLRGVE